MSAHPEAGRRAASAGFPLQTLAPRAAGGAVLAFVETPRGSRNKYKFDEERQIFVLHKTLPVGNVYPWDFGFVPGTRGEDGDPLDVLVLMDEPAFVGCLVPLRLIGVIEAEQEEQGRTLRNDRLLGVAEASLTHATLSTAKELPKEFRDEVSRFFETSNERKRVRVLGVHGPKRAGALLAAGEALYLREKSRVH